PLACLSCAFCPLFSSASPPRRRPPSFPTRRSSDLVLGDEADLPGELFQRQFPDVPPAQRDGAAGHIPEPGRQPGDGGLSAAGRADRKSTRLNSSHVSISYAVFCLKKKKHTRTQSAG